ncbi:unnamed protein product [Discosporangium mesarthrocarpum]
MCGPKVTSSFSLYRTVGDLPNQFFTKNTTVKGIVKTVSDGDTIRVRHVPKIKLPIPGRSMEGKKVSEETLMIRIYAVDTPEIAHFGKPAQPFGAEAKEFTTKNLLGKQVEVKLLSKDQYERAVAKVTYGRWPFRKDISKELIKNGLATLYRQGGAEYDGCLNTLDGEEAAAKAGKVGLWGKAGLETPAEYKARMKAAA